MLEAEVELPEADVLVPDDSVRPPFKLNGGAPLGEVASVLTGSVADWVTVLGPAVLELAAVEDAVAVALEQVAATAELIPGE